MEIRRTRIRGYDIRYGVIPGPADRTPLLICNGLGQCIETLDPVVSELQGLEVIRYDAPGSGESSKPRLPLTINQHSSIALDLLRHLGHRKADVLGVSWGGCVAQDFAYSFPGHCRRLILAVAHAGGLTSIPGDLGNTLEMAIPSRYLSEKRRWKVLPKLYGGDALKDPKIVREQYARNKPPGYLSYLLQLLPAGVWSSILWLHLIKQPTLILSGREDPLTPPANQQLLAKLIPNSTMISYDCGHLLMTTRRAQVAADIRKFLTEQ